jgi:hypothetical protein
LGSDNFQHVHKFLNSITLNQALAALIAEKKKTAGANINHNALDGLLCGAHLVVPLITPIL